MAANALQETFNELSSDDVYNFFRDVLDGNKPAIEEFLNEYPDAINMEDASGQTALMQTTAYGWEDMTQFLLDKGADVNNRNRHGYTALMTAAINSPQMVEFLLDQGAIADEKDNEGKTALMHAQDPEQNSVFKSIFLSEITTLLTAGSEKQKRQREEQHAQWLKDTDFSGGLKKSIPVPRPFKLPTRKV